MTGMPAGGADVAEAEHRGAVGDDDDHVAFERQVEHLGRIVRDGATHGPDAGRLDDRQVLARLERQAAHHLDLAAVMQFVGPVV